ncbi:MOSC domain-containing protein [Flexivirga caeni]|uniref:MOSC domain-containing protein n=1 Tax=Flexivirga caeni TaxID=2294115 RepID=A0A3M9M7M1_9MICO|nr:MOSC N-terminal beta barrel domain-containing protein [Flexivirga caeni]RNI21531.1 MOSC domain-containing protein [Flexivirga caeni]
MQVVSLRIHPVKSTAITRVSNAYVGRAGLRGDREWMVVDSDGAMVSARELPRLFTIRAVPQEPGGSVLLTAEGLPPYQVAASGDDVPATMFGRPPLAVREMAPDAAAWLEEVTGQSGLRLVWCANPADRQLNPDFSQPADHAAFQDGYPVTVASLASLNQLNAWIVEGGGEPVQVDRFRPNIVIDGEVAFAEDAWQSVQIGDVGFRAAKPVDRCAMMLVDASDLTRKNKEPIRTLSRHRKWDGKTWFCHHLIPDTEGEIRVGDQVVARTD